MTDAYDITYTFPNTFFAPPPLGSELKLRKARRLEKKLNDRKSLASSVNDHPSTPTAHEFLSGGMSYETDDDSSEKLMNDEY